MSLARGTARVVDPRAVSVGIERQAIIGADAGAGVKNGANVAEMLRETRTISRILFASTLVFLCFVTTLSIIVGITATSISRSLQDIASTLSPETVQAAATGIQKTIDSGYQSATNLESFTSDTAAMGELLVRAINETVALIGTGNAMAERLLAHPTLQMQLATAPAAEG